MEVCPVGESLVQAGRDVVLAAFQLQEHPDSPRHREHLAAATKRVLVETAKVRGTLGRDTSRGKLQQIHGANHSSSSPLQGWHGNGNS